jgi:hypothetical protein
MKRQWQARFRDWVGGTKYGALCVGVRRRGRGEWMDPTDAPPAVKEFLALKPTTGASRWYCEDFHTTTEMEGGAQGGAQCRREHRGVFSGGLLVSFDVDEPDREPRLLPIHGLVRQLARDVEVKTLFGIYRATYKASTCGVTVGFLIDNKWVYCGDLPNEPLDETLRTHEITAASIGGYVEGWDGELEPITLTRKRGGLLGVDDYWKAVEVADIEAGDVWNETHGCEDCGTPGEYGGNAINSACKTCGGQGVIL